MTKLHPGNRQDARGGVHVSQKEVTAQNKLNKLLEAAGCRTEKHIQATIASVWGENVPNEAEGV